MATTIVLTDTKKLSIQNSDTELDGIYHKADDAVKLQIQVGSENISDICLSKTACLELGKWLTERANEIEALTA